MLPIVTLPLPIPVIAKSNGSSSSRAVNDSEGAGAAAGTGTSCSQPQYQCQYQYQEQYISTNNSFYRMMLTKSDNCYYRFMRQLGAGSYGRVLHCICTTGDDIKFTTSPNSIISMNNYMSGGNSRIGNGRKDNRTEKRFISQECAVKCVTLESKNTDESDGESCRVPYAVIREVSILQELQKLNHPNIIRLYDVRYPNPEQETRYNSYQTPDRKQVNEILTSSLRIHTEVMHYDLRKYIEKLKEEREELEKKENMYVNPLLVLTTMKCIISHILQGVKACHHQNVVHRDLKPANILMKCEVNDEGRTTKFEVKLADFGLARRLDDCNAILNEEKLRQLEMQSPFSKQTANLILAKRNEFQNSFGSTSTASTASKSSTSAGFSFSFAQPAPPRQPGPHGAPAPVALSTTFTTKSQPPQVSNFQPLKEIIIDSKRNDSKFDDPSVITQVDESIDEENQVSAPHLPHLPHLTMPMPMSMSISMPIPMLSYWQSQLESEYQQDPHKVRMKLVPMTEPMVTLWYRSPEILLGSVQNRKAIDMWSVGCIFSELITGEALFPGDCAWGQMMKIFQYLGTPDERVMPGAILLPEFKNKRFPKWSKYHPDPQNPNPFVVPSEYNGSKNKKRKTKLQVHIESKFNELYFSDVIKCQLHPTEIPKLEKERTLIIELLSKLLDYNVNKRITAHEALEHEYFSNNLTCTPKESESGTLIN